MNLNNKNYSEIIFKMLMEYAGEHSQRITTVSAEKYKRKLLKILTRHDGSSPIDIILPGFPYKSANSQTKVLGKLPDLGEKIALERLEALRAAIARKLGSAIRVIICSDGFAFNDLKNIPDIDVIAYRAALRSMALIYPNIEIKSLDDFIPSAPSKEMRESLMASHGTSVETLRMTMDHDVTQRELYQNLCIFAKYDLLRKEGESKKAFKSRCKETALHVVARSKAWAGLLAQHYPNAIRLSIHPYTDVSEKFPICLLPSIDGRWRTPWHNVAVVTEGTPFNQKVKLIPRKYAEAAGAILNYKNGRPWSYTSKELCTPLVVVPSKPDNDSFLRTPFSIGSSPDSGFLQQL